MLSTYFLRLRPTEQCATPPTTGYCIIFPGASIRYSRRKRQHCIALSSTETDAEVMAASQTATEIFYSQGISPRDLGMYQGDPTALYINNTGAEEVARELKSCSRSLAATSKSANLRPTGP